MIVELAVSLENSETITFQSDTERHKQRDIEPKINFASKRFLKGPCAIPCMGTIFESLVSN